MSVQLQRPSGLTSIPLAEVHPIELSIQSQGSMGIRGGGGRVGGGGGRAGGEGSGGGGGGG